MRKYIVLLMVLFSFRPAFSTNAQSDCISDTLLLLSGHSTNICPDLESLLINYSEKIESVNGGGEKANLQVELGLLYFVKQDYYNAQINFQRALNYYNTNGEKLPAAQMYYALGQIERAHYAFDKALDYFYTGLRSASGNPEIELYINVALAEVDIDRGFYTNALSILEIAIEEASSLKNEQIFTAILDHIVQIYNDRLEYSTLKSLIETYKRDFTLLSATAYDAYLDFVQAKLWEQKWQFDLALTYFINSESKFHLEGKTHNIWFVKLNLGQLQQRLGQYDLAAKAFEEVIADAPATSSYYANAQMFLGDLLLVQYDHQIALNQGNHGVFIDTFNNASALYDSSLAIHSKLRNLNEQALVLNKQGELAMRTFSWHNSANYFAQALDIHKETGNLAEWGRTLNNLGVFNIRMGNYSLAENYFYDGIELIQDIDPIQTAWQLNNLAYVFELRGNDSKAIETYRQAASLLTAIYAGVGSENNQLSFSLQPNTLLPYEQLIRIYALNTIIDTTSDAKTIFTLTEQSRARSFLFRLGNDSINIQNADLRQWQHARTRLIELNANRLALSQTPENKAHLDDLSNQIDLLETELALLESEIGLPNLRQLTSVNTIDADEVSARLQPNTAIISYYVLPEVSEETRYINKYLASRVVILILSSSGIQIHVEYIDSIENELLEPIKAFRRNTRNTVALEPLYVNLIAPIEHSLANYENLIFIPHDILNYIPFEVLKDKNDQQLIDKFKSISYSPSSTVYFLSGSKTSSHIHNPLIMAYGDDLIYAQAEVETIASIFGVDGYVGNISTETLIVNEASRADLIHIAAHGIFDISDPLASYISLSKDDEKDGRLEVREILNLSLQENKPLVVLSACETAVAQINPGDELTSLARSFLISGARGVIASLWAVDDTVTSELMTLFYNNLKLGMREPEALTEAKRQIRSRYPSPYFWAGFILAGTHSE